jgi:hypothetical protein
MASETVPWPHESFKWHRGHGDLMHREVRKFTSSTVAIGAAAIIPLKPRECLACTMWPLPPIASRRRGLVVRSSGRRRGGVPADSQNGSPGTMGMAPGLYGYWDKEWASGSP